MDRRSFLKLGGLAVAAPYVITTPGLLMPVKSLWGRSPAVDALTDVRSVSELYARQYAANVANLLINSPIIIPSNETLRGDAVFYQTARLIGGPKAGTVFDFTSPVLGALTPETLKFHEDMALHGFNRLVKKVENG